ncbi:Ragulator complex protein LAMTOR5-like protein [Acropora cervicornis]|uniref:Late endosomal/lysosomal adaptor and MAPK and MTOR activator 5 n=1 Tax=Acropora cervicornis TaxID=6130 RepID=A0AAD9R2E4_ACRCE|nr:Ragulator complex protein LAMTOR5-like protein [Acropora cervicornis]
MEKSLDSHLDDLMSEHGVIGVMCCDKQGLALEGTGRPKVLYKMLPDVENCINLLIKSEGDVTVAVHKVPS